MNESNTDNDTPSVVFNELLEEIRAAINNAPRTLQTALGPSEYGDPCSRSLIHRLTGDKEPEDKVAWKAWVGTCMHDRLERIFQESPMQHASSGPRYLIEQQVTIGEIDGTPISGKCDLFDTLTGIVWDWKTKSPTTLKEARRNGASLQHKRQAHGYGRGMQLAGHTVRHVGNVYLPRNGEFDEICYWTEPYDEQIAVDALNRCTGLTQLVNGFGKDAALSMYPTPCDNRYCYWCKPDPATLPTKTTRKLFAAK